MDNNGNFSDEHLLSLLKKRFEEGNRFKQTQASILEEMGKLNSRLRKVEQTKSDFLSNVRNEINNPLTSILGLTEQIMTRKVSDPEQIQRMAELINKEAFALDFQLRNIFAAAEIEAGEVSPHPAKVEVHALIEDQIQYFRHRSVQRNIRVTYSHEGADHNFKTDAYMLKCIFMNLLANAIEFSTEDNEVVVKSSVEAGQFILQVKDFGMGINPDDYDHIFDRFHQLEGGTTKKHHGHGLGLSIVKEFVDGLRGMMDIQSQKGTPTIVTITLPELSAERLPEGFSTGNEILFGDEELM